MTRKDYELIAQVINYQREVCDTQDSLAAVQMVAEAMARALELDGGYDLNGNKRFKSDRFLAACGFGEPA